MAGHFAFCYAQLLIGRGHVWSPGRTIFGQFHGHGPRCQLQNGTVHAYFAAVGKTNKQHNTKVGQDCTGIIRTEIMSLTPHRGTTGDHVRT